MKAIQWREHQLIGDHNPTDYKRFIGAWSSVDERLQMALNNFRNTIENRYENNNSPFDNHPYLKDYY